MSTDETVPVPTPLRTPEIFEALSLLTPYDTSSMTKIRVGPNHDGGYVMFDDINNISDLYSYGIGGQVEFEEAMGLMGKSCFMYDHTISAPPYAKPYFKYFHEGIAGRDTPDQNLFTLEFHVNRNGHQKRNDLLLKLDVEGAEYDAINACAPNTLKQFRQIVMELHWLSRLTDSQFRRDFISAINKLNESFTLCHVHSNNCAPVMFVDGHIIADVLELTFIRSDLIEAQPSATVYPTEFDHANAWWRQDNLLWFYPFLPVGMPHNEAPEAFRRSLRASEQTLKSYTIQRLKNHKNRLAIEMNDIDERVGALSDITPQ